ncbi:MAG: hypothetical protein J6F31_02480 [Oscillospiraceae bacterium]|nr:hypothetical protein [Oscillospiraceae bacterium]
MESYNDYDRFKQNCNAFKDVFFDTYFQQNGIFCHPLLENMIYVPCSPEEQKSNGLNICRMRDMLIMSSNAEDFEPFEINKARQIAAENGFVYIADLVDPKAFKAADWMVDGKHDTVIVSEEDMRKNNRPYAPVTPLTNVTLPFKKVECAFLYKKGTVESPAFMTSSDIDEMLTGHLTEALKDFENIEIAGSASFDIYGAKADMDPNESRCAKLDKSLSLLDAVTEEVGKNKDALNAADYKFDLREFTLAGLEMAAKKCGIAHDPKSFEGKNTLEELKEQFRKNVSEKNTYGFKYASPDEKSYADKLRAIEGSDADAETLKKDIASLLCLRPVKPAVFNLARAVSPADAENVENIAEFWGVSSLDIQGLQKYLSDSYIPADARDEQGRICCGSAKARFILDELKTAAEKYKIKNIPAIDELGTYISDEEKEQRTYNGTVFDTVEDMNKAQENEKKLIEECEDLSALDEEELSKLRKLIYGTTLDKKTKGKYLLKVKLAELDAEKNKAQQMLIGLGTRSMPELEGIKEKLSGMNEASVRPFAAKVENAILSAQAKELSEKFASIPDKAKAEELDKLLESGKYDPMFTRRYRAKLNDARDGFARKELDAVTAGLDKAEKTALAGIKAKIDALSCRPAVKAQYLKAVTKRADAIEEAEVSSVFADIDKADKAKCDSLKKIIEEGRYRKQYTDRFAASIDRRLVDIENAEFIKKCDTIPTMDKAALDAVTEELKSGKYPAEINEKYLKAVDERSKVLIRNEADAIVRDIDKADFAKLDEMLKKLADGKFPEELRKEKEDLIAKKRKTLYNEEVDKLCRDIDKLDKKAALELKEKLGNENYDKEYVSKYLHRIDERIDKVEREKAESLAKDADKLDKAAIEKRTEEIKALGFKEENIKPSLEKLRKREIDLMKAELETLCKNIPNTSRPELAKLKEALSSGDFDKELSAKYIEQIDKRTEELIKKELSELCKNIPGSPKEKLLEMQKKIAGTPEYAVPGKAYAEQIENRIKQIDKAEFDKQMQEIEKLDKKALAKFEEDLEKRKSSMDQKTYDSVLAKVGERGDFLDRKELDELIKGVEGADLTKLHDLKESITDGDFDPKNTYTYIKKIDDAINNRHVEYFSKLTANIKTLSRAELVVLLEKIEKNENHCPDDMLGRYVGMVKAKIRDADRAELDVKCQGIRSFSEYKCFEYIKDINDMDIDPDAKKDYINRLELQITNLRTLQRDNYVTRFTEQLIANGVPEATFYMPTEKTATVFEQRFRSVTSSFASLSSPYELGVIIFQAQPDNNDEAYMVTLDYLYYHTKSGFDRVAVESIDKFEGKNTLFKKTLSLVEKNSGKTHELPLSNVVKNAENLSKALNSLLRIMQHDISEIKLKEAADRKAMEDEKQREIEQRNADIANARRKAADEEKREAQIKEAEQRTAAEKAAAKAEAEEKAKNEKNVDKFAEIKAIKPIEIVVSKSVTPTGTTAAPAATAAPKPAEAPKAEDKPKAAEAKPAAVSDVKPIKPIATVVSKPSAPAGSTAAQEAPKAAPAGSTAAQEAPKAAPTGSTAPKAEAPKAAETAKPVDKPKADAPKPAEKTEEKPKIRFCDQCGAKIPNENAKFCMECGNKLTK